MGRSDTCSAITQTAKLAPTIIDKFLEQTDNKDHTSMEKHRASPVTWIKQELLTKIKHRAAQERRTYLLSVFTALMDELKRT